MGDRHQLLIFYTYDSLNLLILTYPPRLICTKCSPIDALYPSEHVTAIELAETIADYDFSCSKILTEHSFPIPSFDTCMS